MAADDWAIVIGITSYPNLGPNTKPLQGAHLDAQAFRDWLVEPEGGGVPPDNVRLILWPPGSDAAKMGSVHARDLEADGRASPARQPQGAARGGQAHRSETLCLYVRSRLLTSERGDGDGVVDA